MHVNQSPKTIARPGEHFEFDSLGITEPGITTFPLYVLSDVGDATSLLNLFHLDLYHTFGRDLNTEEYQLEVEGWPPDRDAEIQDK